MHILLTILQVLGGLFVLAVIVLIAAYAFLTSDGSNPFQ